MKRVSSWLRSTPKAKQLVTLLLMATWISVARVHGAYWHGWYSPQKLFLHLLADSLPALLFGGIGLWWFSRN